MKMATPTKAIMETVILTKVPTATAAMKRTITAAPMRDIDFMTKIREKSIKKQK